MSAASAFALEVRSLERRFGDHVAVRPLDLDAYHGEVLGIIGPDGAGKTTLIRMLVGVLAPDAGTVQICGHDLAREHARTRLLLGYMSQAFSLYEDLTVAENISFFASIRGVSRKDLVARQGRLLQFTRLAPFTGRLAGALSGGMKQKLGLICTLVHDPRILFLDEPTNGVDPVSRREFWDIVGELKGRVTVVVATPYMDEAERCDRVALMAGGRLLAVDTPEGLREAVTEPVWEVTLDNPFEVAAHLERTFPGARVQLFGDRIHVSGPLDMRQLLLALQHADFLGTVKRVEPSMEDAYVRLACGVPARMGVAGG